MEFLSSLAIKALIGTSICGTVTVGTIYKCDRTLLGFAPLNNSAQRSGSEGDKVSGVTPKKPTLLGQDIQVNEPPLSLDGAVLGLNDKTGNDDDSSQNVGSQDTSVTHNTVVPIPTSSEEFRVSTSPILGESGAQLTDESNSAPIGADTEEQEPVQDQTKVKEVGNSTPLSVPLVTETTLIVDQNNQPAADVAIQAPITISGALSTDAGTGTK